MPDRAKAIEAMARGIWAREVRNCAWDDLTEDARGLYRIDAEAALAALEAEGWGLTSTREGERLRKLIEPDEWMGWEQVDSIYEEARLLRRERDEARALLAERAEALSSVPVEEEERA